MKKAILILTVVCCAAILMPTQRASGLGQRQAVIYIRAIAADLELTPAQVKNLTQQQAYNYIVANYPKIPTAKLKELAVYWKGIKIMLYNDAVERQTVARVVLWLQQHLTLYPDAVGLDTDYAKELGRRFMPLLYGEVDPNEID